MTELFRRRYALVVGDVEVTGLDVAFSVTRTLDRSPNRASVRAWNLARERRDALERMDGVRVRLEAGYETGVAVIFDGTLDRAHSEKSGADWVTEIKSGDGARALRSARVSQSYRTDASVRALLEHCASALGVGMGNAADAFATAQTPAGSVLRQGTAVSGRADDVLTHLCDAAGLEWSVQGGVLQVLSQRRALRRQAVRLAPESGLVGSPSVDSRGKLKAEALLIPELEPGRLVIVDSAHVEGTWRLTSVTYTGESSGQAWGASVEGAQEGRAAA